MNLAKVVTTLPIQPHLRWAVMGLEAEAFAAKLSLGPDDIFLHPDLIGSPKLQGLLLAGALSAQVEPMAWLKQVLELLPEEAILMVVDWQGDGPLDDGPDLERRFKRGKLSRLLREGGFSQIELLVNHPIYYVVQAVKRPPTPRPHTGEFITVASLTELPKNSMKQVELFGQPVIVANTGQEIVAFAQACPHAGTSLLRGKLRGRTLICPLHFYMWDVCTGEPIEPADEDRLPLYSVRVDSESELIQVALQP